jgi:acyl dehydratase
VTGPDLYFEDVEIGGDIGPVERTVTDDQVAEFVRNWGDFSQPSRFTDAEFARQEGLPGPIVPGALSMALMGQLVVDRSSTFALSKLDVVFRGLVPHHVPLKLSGIITDKGVVDGEPQFECDVILEDQQGVRLVIGRATVGVPMRVAAG